MAKFSPGPWRVSREDDETDSRRRWVAVVSASDRDVASLHESLYPEADARLIAAAPEMLDLLRERPTSDDADHEIEEWETRRSTLLARIDRGRDE